MRLTRKQFVAGGAGALAAAGIYGLVDRFTGAAPREVTRVLPSEQHALGRLEVVVDNGVEVVVPPLHHEVVTATLRVEETAASLREAQEALDEVLRRGDNRYGPAPAGLSISVGWGLPYFERSRVSSERRIEPRADAIHGPLKDVRCLTNPVVHSSAPAAWTISPASEAAARPP